MKRIIYLSPFAADNIAGGIKVMFGHVAMLRELGYDACVYSPAGRPVWFSTHEPLFSGPDLFSNPDHLLVFPELLNGKLGAWALAEMQASKILLCQNQYYTFSEALQARPLHELGFVQLLTVGQVARGFLERVFAPAAFEVVPTWIDDTIFRPREKAPAIALFPRKLPQSYEMIRRIFCAKYPQLKDTLWRPIHEVPEQRAAEILGEATVFLSLCDRECCPLSPLEAMASGCAVVGFHGYGGLEYATADNGLWLPPDHLEETADALASLLVADARQEPRMATLRAKGHETARQFTRARTMAELDRIFALLAKPAAAPGTAVLRDIEEWLTTL
jgi:glycosyltransferase involved in cell wall biosynthesis